MRTGYFLGYLFPATWLIGWAFVRWVGDLPNVPQTFLLPMTLIAVVFATLVHWLAEPMEMPE